jgi:hypothetical protein
VDPLFFYALSVGRAERPCVYMDAGLAVAVTALRTFADVGHLGHVLLQFRLAASRPSSSLRPRFHLRELHTDAGPSVSCRRLAASASSSRQVEPRCSTKSTASGHASCAAAAGVPSCYSASSSFLEHFGHASSRR